MKFFVVPEPVALVNTITKEPLKYGADHPQKGEAIVVSAHRFLTDNVLSSTKIGKGVDAIRRIQKLDSAFETASPGDLVGIEDADYTVVKEILNTMEFASPLIAAQLSPFFEAWESAQNQGEEWKRKQTVKAVESSE